MLEAAAVSLLPRHQCRSLWRGYSSVQQTILLIPGTSAVEHLRENLKAATLEIPKDTVAKLNSIGEKVIDEPC